MWCLKLSIYLSNEDLLVYFPWHLLLGFGKKCVNMIYIPFIYYYWWQTLFCYEEFLCFYHNQMMLLLIMLMMRILLSFHLKLNSHQYCLFISPLQQTLKHHLRTSHTQLLHVNLVILPKSNYIFSKIRYFFKFSF